MEPWTRLARHATRFDGIVTATDLERLGVGRRQRENWIRGGRLERVAPRVWRVIGAPDTWHQRLRTGLAYLGDEAAVSHEAAAQLHRFDRTPPDQVEFIVPVGARRWSLPFGTVHTTGHLPLIDRTRIDGWPVTSATRTVLDLAMQRPGRARLEAAIDSAVRSRASAPEVLQRRLADLRGPGRWGCRLVDELSHRIIVEVSGGRGHSSPAERAKDAQRRNELQDLGWRVYEYTWDDVVGRPQHVVRTMRERLDVAVPGGRDDGRSVGIVGSDG